VQSTRRARDTATAMSRLRERTFVCLAHGPFRANTHAEVPCCPRGCSRGFIRLPDGSLPSPRISPLLPRQPRIVRKPEPDERLPADHVRAQLLRLLDELPHGAKRPLALALGFRGRWARQSLRSIVKGRGNLFEAVRRRLSRRLLALQRGELIVVPTGFQGPGKRLYEVVPRTHDTEVRVGDTAR
jgi:hypothetical protein